MVPSFITMQCMDDIQHRPDQVETYYNLSSSDNDKVNNTIDILLNYGPIMFLSIAPFAAYLLLYPIKGLKYTIIIVVNLVFFGSFIVVFVNFIRFECIKL